MINMIFVTIEAKDWILLGLGVLGSIIWPVFIFQLKPQLTIDSPLFSGGELKLPITNHGCFDAINVKIEACSVVFNDFTYHFSIDKEDFIAIPCKKYKDMGSANERVFKSKCLAKSALDQDGKFDDVKAGLLNGNDILRIRIYATHAFTGFGRLLEAHFKYDIEKKRFIKI
jgi:hypothetical protein